MTVDQIAIMPATVRQVRPKALDFRQFAVLSMHSMHDPFNGAKSTLPGKRLSVGGHHYLREGWF